MPDTIVGTMHAAMNKSMSFSLGLYPMLRRR
jgi:hypothetical protein